MMGICLGAPAKSGPVSGAKVAPGNAKQTENLSISSNLKSFTFEELKRATRNFSPDNLFGEGGLGLVFKGWIDEFTMASSRQRTAVAVKRIKTQSFQGHQEWLSDVRYLGQLQHENLVRLIGYCPEPENRMLVHEFMAKGSLENHLFNKGVQQIPWSTRMQIATDVARGISFLHSLNPNVIYRDLKASNILIDSKSHAKLLDFGLTREGSNGDGTHISIRVGGTMGYAAPEYVASGHWTQKSDVYSFGVLLLELISGKRALGDETVAGPTGILVDWAKPFLEQGKQFSRIMDTRLRGVYSKRGARASSVLALKCLEVDPRKRPTMVEVLDELEQQRALMSLTEAKMDHRIRTLSTHSAHYVS